MEKQMKKSVAVITPFSTGNFGTVLQAYATQKTIVDLGYDCTVVDYRWDNIENPFLLSNLIRRKPINYFTGIVGHLLRLPKRKDLNLFIDKYLNLSKRVRKSNIYDLNEQFDCFIAGSDCIWNSEAFGLDTVGFLEFVKDNNKKGNYGSSFASDNIPDKHKQIIKELLSKFRYLSVREEKGKDLIEELLGITAEVVVDPTLLINKSHWSKISDDSKIKIGYKYLLIIEYSMSRQMLNDAEEIAEKMGYKIVSLYFPKGKRIRTKVFSKASPQDYLFLIKNAELILTDSYHTTILAINFNVNVYTYITKTSKRLSTRFYSILNKLNLMDRLIDITGNNEIKNQIELGNIKNIDFEKVNKLLDIERKKSKSFLTNELCEILGKEK